MKTAEGTGSLLRPIQRESVVWNMITSKSIICLLVCGRSLKKSNLFTFRKTATIGFFLKVVLSKICLSIFNHHVSSHSIVKHILIICKVTYVVIFEVKELFVVVLAVIIIGGYPKCSVLPIYEYGEGVKKIH